MKWLRPEGSTQCSTQWQCPVCGKKVYYNHGLNARKLKSGQAQCPYTYCPWCGKQIIGGTQKEKCEGCRYWGWDDDSGDVRFCRRIGEMTPSTGYCFNFDRRK